RAPRRLRRTRRRRGSTRCCGRGHRRARRGVSGPAAHSPPLGYRVPGMAGIGDRVKRWFARSENVVKEEVEGGEPVARPSEGLADGERETSTNAQTAAASDEPWPGNN